MPKPENSNRHIGSNFDDFLEEEGIAAEVNGHAVREIIARLVTKHMAQAGPTKAEMAARIQTIRQALARLLDPKSGGLTLDSLEWAAIAAA